jgi:ElaB/YqjD/DUF883 family membrane-anchored ribosome-binding protein
MTIPGNEPDRLRRDIERTQQSLSTDVDRLAEKVAPGQVVRRRVGRARRAMTGMRDRVMGTASDTTTSARDRIGEAASTAGDKVGDTASSIANTVSDTASSVADTVSDAPRQIRRGTEGNPLAAGLIAFGAGWLVSSLIPASRAEQKMADQAKDAVREYGQPVAEQVAADLRDNLREPARHAVEEVRSTASDATDTVKEEARHAADTVADRAAEAKNSVQEQRN